MIRLLSLNIQAFRGIRDRVDLDLSAPLTLIYAANGSGKTTICEAAEWLLTGTIKRLEAMSADDEIRCNFSPEDQPTLVSAHLDVDGEALSLQRSLTGCRWRRPGGNWRTVTPSDLLEKLAPSAAEEGVHRRHANSSRQIWLRGTRFLAGETLGTLLDSDEDSLSGRQRLFADLLGVGHLLETERQLDNYLAEINQAVRKQRALIDVKDAQIRDRVAKIGSDVEVRERERLVEVGYHVRLAANLLRFPTADSDPATYNAAISAVTTVETNLEGRRIRLQQQRRAETELSADWQQRSTIAEELQKDRARIITLGDEEKAIDTSSIATSEEIVQATAAVKRNRESIANLERFQKELREAQEAAAVPLADYIAEIGRDDIKIEGAFELVEKDQASTPLSKLQSLRDELPTILRHSNELAARKRDFEETSASAPTPEGLVEIQKALSDAGDHLQDVRLQYERASGPLGQLRHLSANLVSLLGDNECTCPVCTYTWDTPAALRAGLQNGLSSLPASLLVLEDALRTAEAQQKTLQDRLLSESQTLARMVVAEREYRRVENALGDFAARVSEVGLKPDLAELRQAIEQGIKRIYLINALTRLRQLMLKIDEDVGIAISRSTSAFNVQQVLASALDEEKRREQGDLVAADNRLTTAQARQQEHQETRSRLQTERVALERRIQQNTRRIQVVDRAWSTLAGSVPQSDATLRELSANLTEEFDNLQLVERALGQARISLQRLAAEQELEALEKEREPLIRECDRLTHYSESAISIKQSYTAHRTDHIKRQMTDIVRAMSALFTRMQANLVYDDVTSGEEQTPLSWRAFAENLTFNPEATFSQGQRQDFALSIFLARARGLGGTFLLDEPVAHLDDLNRVALLDVFRAIAVESPGDLSFVLTTAHRPLVRHLMEKFARLSSEESLRLIEIEGNPRTGVRISPQPAPILDG